MIAMMARFDDLDRSTVMSELLNFLGQLISGFFDGAAAKSRWRRRAERAFAAMAMLFAALVIYQMCK
ncbi:hypothetical protein [Rhizobium sp. SL86]|uniref:hypothetical protein n=1 Tax=Rhizobium sp. SL86 TaxID=2995148 RepID=UPI002276C708|nr:hypothetical protein [Rhizobium sp. SL86]MCY1666178.1 hypothetical protein [Rhizobium sp. SL86]